MDKGLWLKGSGSKPLGSIPKLAMNIIFEVGKPMERQCQTLLRLLRLLAGSALVVHSMPVMN
jgi:hypothetical protein